MRVKGESEVAQSCPTLHDPMDCMQPTRLLCPWDFPGKSTGVGCHCLLWNIEHYLNPNSKLFLLFCSCFPRRMNDLSKGFYRWNRFLHEFAQLRYPGGMRSGLMMEKKKEMRTCYPCVWLPLSRHSGLGSNAQHSWLYPTTEVRLNLSKRSWVTSWNQDCQEKYQQPQICGWYHPKGRKQRGTKEPLDERGEWKRWLETQHSKN